MRHHFVAHITAIDVGILLIGAAASKVGQAAAPPHANRAGYGLHHVFHRQAVGHKFVTQYIGHAAIGIGRGAPLLDQLAVVPNGKAHVWPHQRMAAHGIQAMRQLGCFTLEEFAPRGRAEKQLAHLNGCALRTRARAHFPAAGMQKITVRSARHGRQQRKLGHRGNGRQRLTAKAHGRDRFQIVQIADFAGGVALHGQRQLLLGNACAVVFYRDQTHATGLQTHGDLRGARIQRVV